jgi:PAB-dependent poly(A)-specific ribonuclease subunit 3
MGDRYVLKLFRDYVFHQTLSDGAPVVDGGHVVTALNKLDTGDTEQMLLSSRDNKDLLVVSFADVRRYLSYSLTSTISDPS